MTAPRPRTVAEVAAPYANHLTPVPRQADGVCPICRTGCDGWPRCFNCGRSLGQLPRRGADTVGLVALAPSREQLAYELVNYKRPATASSVRERFAIGLACVLWTWLSRHGDCLANAAGLASFGDFDIITTVPSSNRSRSGEHPLVRVASGIVVGTNERYRQLLTVSSTPVGDREYRPDRFLVRESLHGARVLVVDDTWTSGAQLQSAAESLKNAGAAHVAALAIGRWYHPGAPQNSAVDEQLKGRRWSWDECIFDG